MRGITDIVPHNLNASYTNTLCGALHPCVQYDTFGHGEEGCPTSHLLSHLVYQFECRNCDSRYVGRTLQHLSARIKQHVPLHMVPDAAKVKHPKRWRPHKNPLPLPPTQPEQVEHTVQRKSGGSLSQPNVPSPPLPLPPPEPPPVLLVAGVGVESATTTVPPITEIDPISLTQYPVVRTPQHAPALDPWVQRPRRSTANYSTEIYARNGQGPLVTSSSRRCFHETCRILHVQFWWKLSRCRNHAHTYTQACGCEHTHTPTHTPTHTHTHRHTHTHTHTGTHTHTHYT